MLNLNTSRNAIVIGASITGLLAARVLIKYFDRVTIIERDHLKEEPESRLGVPQSTHAHVLLAKSQQILEQLFPGLTSELTAAGAIPVDWNADWRILDVWG
jgi:2-polyprenyl-6-methoxyphenol hydroxylase-like FAD-dependent oxidoreductase